MGIEEYYKGLELLRKDNSLDVQEVENQVEELKNDPKVIEYFKKVEQLTKLKHEETVLISEYNDITRELCDHPIYVYDYELVSIRCVVPIIYCPVCYKMIYDVSDEDLVKLYESKRLLAKKIDLDNGYYDLEPIENLDDEVLRKTYLELSKRSNNKELFNPEDVLFDHLTGNNRHVRRMVK